jgi:Domain of unknown function (DUF4336)
MSANGTNMAIAPGDVRFRGYSGHRGFRASCLPLTRCSHPAIRDTPVQEAIRKMPVGASLYEPINVFKPIGPEIGIVDGPFEYLTVAGVRLPLPFTTRMTVVRLSNGDLFLHSPIKFDETLASGLQQIGTIRHLVSPNQFHYAHIGEWSKAFPDAIPWASPRVRQRARARHIDVTFARDLDFNPPEEWRQDIDQALFPGGYFKEFIFFHKKSKTLVLTDTIINIELDKMTEPWRTATKLSGMYYPRGQIFFGMRLPLWLQQRKARAAFAKIRAWRPERVVLSHGRCFEAHGNEVVERIFGGAAPLK